MKQITSIKVVMETLSSVQCLGMLKLRLTAKQDSRVSCLAHSDFAEF